MIGIGISFVLGGLLGWAADHFLNRGEKMVIHPLLCIIFGVVGAVVGSWVMSTLFGGNTLKSILLQMGGGLGGSLLLLLLIAMFGMGDDY
jgi:uncharacterized membrane protein YeaQ/YmgE (transglycosylase-associated protein family)